MGRPRRIRSDTGHDLRRGAGGHRAEALIRRSFFIGGQYWPDPLPSLAHEVDRFHETVTDLAAHVEHGTPRADVTPERLLQGPLADAMTHAGQLALLRRLFGDPIPPENFVVAEIHADRLGRDQAEPASPDAIWPEAPAGWSPAKPRTP